MDTAGAHNGQVMLTLREHLITPPVFGDPCLYDYISRIRQCYYVFFFVPRRAHRWFLEQLVHECSIHVHAHVTLFRCRCVKSFRRRCVKTCEDNSLRLENFA